MALFQSLKIKYQFHDILGIVLSLTLTATPTIMTQRLTVESGLKTQCESRIQIHICDSKAYETLQ